MTSWAQESEVAMLYIITCVNLQKKTVEILNIVKRIHTMDIAFRATSSSFLFLNFVL